jgi:hypothetical protein
MSSAYVPDAIHGCWEKVKAAIPSAQLGGIYADKPGYHNCRNQLPSSDYSVQKPYDQQGDGWAAAALDITLSDADMKRCTQRLIDETTAHGDTGALRALREFFGTTDGNTVTGMDVPGRYFVTSDPSHLWHIHASGKRSHTNDAAAWDDVAAVLLGGEADMPLNDDDARVVWNHNIQLWNDSTPDAYFVLSAIHQYLQTDRLRDVNWQAVISLWNGSTAKVEDVLDNLHQTVHRIDDRLERLEQQTAAAAAQPEGDNP